jgi:hypothetical protein
MSEDIKVTVSAPAQITVQFDAQQGASGPPGPAGGVTTFTFTQSSPQSTWLIAHNLARFPSVTVIDSGGSEVEGDVDYVDSNHISVAFSAPFSGTAYLN